MQLQNELGTSLTKLSKQVKLLKKVISEVDLDADRVTKIQNQLYELKTLETIEN